MAVERFKYIPDPQPSFTLLAQAVKSSISLRHIQKNIGGHVRTGNRQCRPQKSLDISYTTAKQCTVTSYKDPKYQKPSARASQGFMLGSKKRPALDTQRVVHSPDAHVSIDAHSRSAASAHWGAAAAMSGPAAASRQLTKGNHWACLGYSFCAQLMTRFIAHSSGPCWHVIVPCAHSCFINLDEDAFSKLYFNIQLQESTCLRGIWIFVPGL